MSRPDARDASSPQGLSVVTGPDRAPREVPAAMRIVGFAAVLSAVFGGALLAGERVGPLGEPAAAGAVGGHAAVPDDGGHEDGHGGAAADAGADVEAVAGLPGGLQVSQAGYTLDLVTPALERGTREVAFRIVGPDGSAVTDYEVEHEKELHLIAVRRDFTGYQHVHPERGPDGTWSAPLRLTGGTWRLFADFTPARADTTEPLPLTLGTDLMVTGPTGTQSAVRVEPRSTDTVDGYRVDLTGRLRAGGESRLRFAVSRAGRQVAELQPYLGARGHLVALREGDLAYLHVHPLGDPSRAGADVAFAATAPSAGGYRLYLDFRIGGVVRTASFALSADEAPAGRERGGSGDDHGEGQPEGEHAH